MAGLGLLPALALQEERPPTQEDFIHQTELSLSCLESLACLPAERLQPGPNLVLLLSQHSLLPPPRENTASNIDPLASETLFPVVSPTIWSSSRHQDLALQILERLCQNIPGDDADIGVSALLVRQDRKLLAQIVSLLQPQMKQLVLYPSGPHCLCWVVSQLSEPALGLALPLLLPLCLACLDSWLVCPRVLGARTVTHICSLCPPTQLSWYGRADLLYSALIPLVSGDLEVVRWVRAPLTHLTKLRHTTFISSSYGSPGSLPSPADQTMERLLSLCQMESTGSERGTILIHLINDVVGVLGPGVLRWVASLSSLLASQPSNQQLQALVSSLLVSWPKAVAREMEVLVPCLVQEAYTRSWASPPHIPTSLEALLTALVEADMSRAQLLCQGLAHLTVNPTFDALVQRLQLCE